LCLYKTKLYFISFAKKALAYLKISFSMRTLYFFCPGVLTLPAHLQQVRCLEFTAHEALSSGRAYWRLYPMIWLLQGRNNLALTPAQPPPL
jgi:hypothetical protein